MKQIAYLPMREGHAERVEGEIDGREAAIAVFDADSERWLRSLADGRKLPPVLTLAAVMRWMRRMRCKIVVFASFDA